MIRSKFAKVIILSTSITVFSSGMAFAEIGSGQSAVVQPTDVRIPLGKQVEFIQPADTGGALDASVERPSLGNSAINDEVLMKQKEIDLYLFDQNREEIAQKDFTVTHTVPHDNYVEIGITPYSEANAEYLYKALGKDMVKVVEGMQALPMTVSPDAPDAVVSGPKMANSAIVEDGEGRPSASNRLEAGSDSKAELYAANDAVANARDTEQTGSSMPVTLASAAAALILGGAVIAARRRSAAGR